MNFSGSATLEESFNKNGTLFFVTNHLPKLEWCENKNQLPPTDNLDGLTQAAVAEREARKELRFDPVRAGSSYILLKKQLAAKVFASILFHAQVVVVRIIGL